MSDVSRSRDSSDSYKNRADASADEHLRHMTDARLVEAITRAEVDALAEAYDRHARFVYGLAVCLCGPQQAEDLTREVFLALWRSPETFVKPAPSLRATLVADMHRRATMSLPHRSRRYREMPIARGAQAEPERLAGPGQERLPSKLPDDHSAVHVAYFSGYTYNQIAGLLGRSKTAVVTEIHAQLRRISTQLE